jgi:hypothetical protein
MALFNYTSREINAKVVYYGPGLSGKTTNIQSIYDKIAPDKKGKLVTLPTYTDRTLFFDFFPLDAGEIKGYKMRFHLYTVPGQVFYNATRRLVLKGADGVVFVADSQEGMMDANVESLNNLQKNLSDLGIDLNDFPFVIQYNKRDLPGVLPIETLNHALNPRNVPAFPASAFAGEGVLETLTAVSRLVLKDLRESIESGQPKKRAAAPAPRILEGEPSPIARRENPPMEDVRQWVREDLSEEGDRQAPLSRSLDGGAERIIETQLRVKVRLVTTVNGGTVRIKRVEVAEFEPKEFKIKE